VNFETIPEQYQDIMTERGVQFFGQVPTTNYERELTVLKCSESSKYSNEGCENSYGTYGHWLTDNEGVGSWIQYYYGHKVVITSMQFRNRICNIHNCGESMAAKLEFSDGSTQTVNFQSRSGLNEIALKPVETIFVKMTITSVYSTSYNGASILKFFGYHAAGYGYGLSDELGYGKFLNGTEMDITSSTIGSTSFSKARDCQTWCNEHQECESFSRCNDDELCYFSSQSFVGNESPTSTSSQCTTYYKKGHLSCSRTRPGGCGNLHSQTLSRDFQDRAYSTQECYALCKGTDECGGFFLGTSTKHCLLVRSGCTQTNDANWDYYSMDDCSTRASNSGSSRRLLNPLPNPDTNMFARP